MHTHLLNLAGQAPCDRPDSSRPGQISGHLVWTAPSPGQPILLVHHQRILDYQACMCAHVYVRYAGVQC